MNKNEISPIGASWREHERELIEKDYLSGELLAESDLSYAIMKELVRARKEQGISQRELERLSGVSYPVIARMETGKSSPRLSTIIKVLAPLGKTIDIVPLERARR
jgi:DNA-binding XRE family transcriptional regulator